MNGNVQDLTQGSKQSLRALIQAIAPETNARDGDTLDRLTEKLSQLVGDEAVEEYKQQRNERGELLNEEGLPIIDITEPVDAEPIRRTSASLPPPVTVEPLIKLSSLPENAQARLKAQRMRVLDLLEEEENQLALREKQREEETNRETLRRKQEDAAKDKERAKEARELQKKMGRALLKNVTLAQEKEHEEKELQRLKDEEAVRRKSPSQKKKTVAFAESVQDSSQTEDNTVQEDWGDITPATLRPSTRPTLLSQEKQPMRMNVVERVPGRPSTISAASLLQGRGEPDSDDESDPEPLDSDEDFDEDEDNDDGQELETDDIDYDHAQHQREIALEYFKKRDLIGQNAAEALKNHVDEHLSENPDVLQDSPTPVISQFRATRLASAYQSSGHTKANAPQPSSSLGDSVLPASGARTIQRSIRAGKLDADGNLVGGEADSASENEDEQLQEVLNLLRKGEVLNVGPDNNYLATIPPEKDPWQQAAASTAAPSSRPVNAAKNVDGPSQLPPPTVHSKVSKFKVSRGAAGRPGPSVIPDFKPPSDLQSPSSTPVSNVGRSSPKSATPIDEKTAEFPNPHPIHVPQPQSSSNLPPQFSMIVESPDFPKPQYLQKQPIAMGSTSLPSGSASQPRRNPPPTLSSTVKETSAFRRPDRPPTVVSSKVTESQSRGAVTTQQPANADSSPPKRVSRFKAERMY